jgi:hypothetical protein
VLDLLEYPEASQKRTRSQSFYCWHYPKISRRGADERMARAVLVGETRTTWSATGERRVKDIVCCEVPVGKDTAMALEVFTSRERAEVELRGM